MGHTPNRKRHLLQPVVTIIMNRTGNSLMELRLEGQGAECPAAAAGKVDCWEGSKALIQPTYEDTEL